MAAVWAEQELDSRKNLPVFLDLLFEALIYQPPTQRKRHKGEQQDATTLTTPGCRQVSQHQPI